MRAFPFLITWGGAESSSTWVLTYHNKKQSPRNNVYKSASSPPDTECLVPKFGICGTSEKSMATGVPQYDLVGMPGYLRTQLHLYMNVMWPFNAHFPKPIEVNSCNCKFLFANNKLVTMQMLFITYKCHHDRTCTHISDSKIKEKKEKEKHNKTGHFEIVYLHVYCVFD